jgi:hypothetical protein
MSDGASQGVTAKRALDTILGGAPTPGEEDQQTPEGVEARIRACPTPEQTEFGRWEAYGDAADYAAHAFLLVADEDPGILTRGHCYPDDYEAEFLRGKARDLDSVLYEAAEQKWGDEVIAGLGLSGFQAGWAANTVRYIKGGPHGQNPAIVEVGGNPPSAASTRPL